MRILSALLIVLSAAAPASATGRIAAAPAGSPRDCANCATVIRVNIVGRRADGTPDDRRDTLARQKAALGLSDAEVARIRATTGIVSCDTDGMRPIASGTLVDSTTVVTAAHVMRDPARGSVALPAGTHCLFRSQSLPPEIVPLRLDGTEIIGSGGQDDMADPNDFAVLRLVHPLHDPAAQPFSIGPSPTQKGTDVILISGFQVDLRPTTGEDDPIVQRATIEQAGPTTPGAPVPVYLTGSMDAGGSGGAMLVREGGILRLVAIVSTTGSINRNGMPFSLQMSSFVRVISIAGGFLSAVQAEAARQP